MADTQALRKRLEAKIAALTVELQEAEADLKAIDRVEKIEAALNDGRTDKVVRTPVIRTPVIEAPPVVPKPIVVDKIVKEVVLAIARAEPGREWSVSTMTPEVHSTGRPDAKKENVSVSMKRLYDEGALILVRQDLRLGNVYKAAKRTTTAQDLRDSGRSA